MRTRLKVLACLAGIAVSAWLPLLGSAAADETYTATSAIAVPIAPGNTFGGLNSFDISFDDPVLQLYLLSDRSNAGLDVVDTSQVSNISGNVGGISVFAAGQFTGLSCVNPKPIAPATTVSFVGGNCTDAAGPNGVATVHQKHGENEAWAGDAPVLSFSCANNTATPPVTVCTTTVVTPSNVKVVDLKTGGVTHIISTATTSGPTGKFNGNRRADELCWDPKSEQVLIANDDPADLYVTFISTKTYTILDQIKFDGSDTTHGAGAISATNGIEQCQWDPRTDAFYLNIPENHGSGSDTTDGAVVVISPTTHKVTATFAIDVTKCAGNQGMAIGPAPQILLGCSNAGPGSVIMDETTGALTNLPGENGNDEVWYNPGDNQYFMAESNNKIGTAAVAPRLGVVDANATDSEDMSAVSALGSHSVAVDPFKGHVFVPINNLTTGNAGANSMICTNASGGTVPSSQGCIAVFTATGKDDKCLVAGAAVVALENNDPQLQRELCNNGRGHDHDR